MIRIQATLIMLVTLGVAIYLAKLRSSLASRLVVAGIATAGIALIAHPPAATALAHAFGVGRGVDLIIYLALAGLGFGALLLWSAVRTLTQKLTEVTRALALATAEDHTRGER